MTQSLLDDLGLRGEEQAFLRRYGFDEVSFARLRAMLAAGDFTPERNVTTHPVLPPAPEDLLAWPEPGSQRAARCEALGREAIRGGRVAAAILNGGMATRFGGGVKGTVEVADGKSFLELKLMDLAAAGAEFPIFLMSSFATEAATAAHLEATGRGGLASSRVHQVLQHISLRLTPEGEVFRGDDGRPDFYAPGHGDLFDVLAGSAAFQRFAEQGGRYVLVSNVDNLAATFSPKVIGAHIAAGKPVTVEVAPRAPGDKGGAPVRHRGRVEVLEGFRFPEDFDISTVPVFNTNTFVLDAAAVRPDYELTWFRADKKVGGRPVVQFERLMGEITSFVDATYLAVPRRGPEGRFLPVKTPDDLDAVRPVVQELFGLGRS